MIKLKDGKHLQKYWPLFSLIFIAAAASCAVAIGIGSSFKEWMHYFMGFFLCQFAMLKIFHPIKFADGFQMYDLIAKQSRFYALAYPVVELILGFAYLSFILPLITYLVTVVVTGIGAAGVVLSLKKGLKVKCACMGSVLDVPLSTVTLTENVGMAGMALLMLLISIF